MDSLFLMECFFFYLANKGSEAIILLISEASNINTLTT